MKARERRGREEGEGKEKVEREWEMVRQIEKRLVQKMIKVGGMQKRGRKRDVREKAAEAEGGRKRERDQLISVKMRISLCHMGFSLSFFPFFSAHVSLARLSFSFYSLWWLSQRLPLCVTLCQCRVCLHIGNVHVIPELFTQQGLKLCGDKDMHPQILNSSLKVCNIVKVNTSIKVNNCNVLKVTVC